MNVAIEPDSAPQPSNRSVGPAGAIHYSEWIDPEGDDWFASIYRELTDEPVEAPVDQPASDPAYWFG